MKRSGLIRKACFFLFVFLFSSTGILLAQERVLSGVVRDAETKEPLPGANVIIKGTTRGTITDLNGNFSLRLQSGDEVLVVSFVGYNNKEIQPGSQQFVEVLLETEKVALGEIVVIGYGTVRKSDLTGSVSSVKAEEMTRITASNPVQGLMGKVAGVQVTNTSGAPGAAPVVRVRGVGTFNNSSPIYVVDGVILDDISFLNASDIASTEVLKDASATAIYGSRGANGVIIITTRSGSLTKGKTVFSYSGEYNLQMLAKKIDLLNGREFAIISNEIRPGSFNNVDAVPNTDWQDLIFHTAPMHNHQFSASGSTENMQFYFGVGYFNQQGIIDKSSYERLTIKMNNTYQLSKGIKLGNNLTIAPHKEQIAPNVTYSAYRAQPVLVPYYPDGSFGVVYNVGNPLADLKYSNNYNKGIRGVGNFFAEATLLKHFTLKSSFGLDASYNKAVSFTPEFTVYNPDGTASQQQNVGSDLYKGTGDFLGWLWENTLNYSQTFGKHTLDAVAGYTMQDNSSESYGISGQNILRDGRDFWYLQPSYLTNTINQFRNSVDPNQYYSMISYLFRVNYTYDGKYIFTTTFRRDGSSKFAPGNRFSNFPSFAAGWNITREKFMEAFPFVSNLKLRASWGIIGNDKIIYTDRFSTVNANLVSVFGVNPTAWPAATYSKSGNPDLKWESTYQTDIGLETGFFQNKLTAEFDFYNKVTKDILVELSTPGYLGNGQGQKVRFNAASVLNRGLEFQVNWREKKNDFSYSVGLLGSTIHNEVLKIGGNVGIDSVLIGGYLGNGIPVTQSRVGLPIGAFYGYKTNGIFQTPEELAAYPHSSQAEVGDLRFVDVNHDSKIDGNDRTFIGSPIPTFIYGFHFEAGYKDFELSLDLQGQTGNKIFNGKEVVRPDPYNFEKHVFNRWTGPGTSNTEPRPSFGGYNYSPSDRFVQDGSFLRLRNITFSYALPSGLSDKLQLSKAVLYLKGTNLYTLTKFTGYTPEIGSEDVLSNGIDNGIYPVTAVYSFGLNITF